MCSALLKLLDVQAGIRVLDVAAGTGRTAIPLAKTGAMVAALDLTPAMIGRMRCKVLTHNLKNLHLQQANARFLPFPDNTFDVVLSFRFLHLFSVEDQVLLLDEFHRVARLGGKVLVEYNNSGARWAGGIFQDISRFARGKNPLSRAKASQLQTLYQHYQVLQQQGFSLPFIGAVARLSPGIANRLLKLSMQDRARPYARYLWIVSAKARPESK